MKQSDAQKNHDRYYEVTDLEEDAVWYTEPGASNDIRGAIVQLLGGIEILVIRGKNLLTTNCIAHVSQMILRPLNQKDQAKLERLRSQYAD